MKLPQSDLKFGPFWPLTAVMETADQFSPPVHEFPASAGEVRPLLVTYDIGDNRRRNRLHRLLRGFGEPLQRSVFLCWVDRPRRARLERLLADFAAVAHSGRERIDCVQACGLECPRDDQWIVE